MAWRKARFRDSDVWAEVDTVGEPRVHEGRIRIRYSRDAGAKLYPAALRNVKLDAAAPVEDLTADLPSKPAETVPPSTLTGAAIAYTDGACRGNPGPAGAGVYIEFPDGRRLRATRPLGRATNNIAELTGIAMAVELLAKANWAGPVVLLTDSSYSIGVLQKGWKAKANVELVASIREQLVARSNFELRKVAGHAGVPGNEEADRLANEAVDGRELERWT